MPAPRAIELRSTDTGGQYLGALYRPVTPEEKIEVSFDYFRSADNQPTPAVVIQFFLANGNQIGTSTVINGAAVAPRWQKKTQTVDTPATAVQVRISAGLSSSGAAGVAYLTNVSGLRTGAGYASAAAVQTLAQSQANDEQALANYKIQADTRLSNVETGVQTNAGALLNTYSKSEANQAAAGQINTYHAEVVQPGLNARASAAVVNAIASRVAETEAGLTATASSVLALDTTTGRYSAGGLFRVHVASTPTGATSRIAIAAAVSAGGATATAGLYLSALTSGKTQVMVIADQFAIATGPAGAPRFPFVVEGNRIRMGDTIVETLSIAGNAVTVPATVASGSLVTLTDNWVDLATVGIPRQAAPTLIMATFQIDGSGAGASLANFRILRDGMQVGSIYPNVTGARGTQTSGAISVLDSDLGTGATSYKLQAQRMSSGDYVGTPRVVQRTVTVLHVKR